MKILHLGKYFPPYYGGMETVLYNLSTELSKKHDVSVIVSNTENRNVNEFVDGVNVIRVKRLGKIASTDICPSMVRYIKDCDIIHLHSPNPMAEVSLLAARPACRLVITYHSDIIKQRILRKLYNPVFNGILKKADRITATSEQYAEGSKWLRKYRNKIRVVPLGIDIDPYTNIDTERIILDNEYGDRLVLFIGRLVYYKGLEYLIKAMKGVEGKLIVIGDGPMKENLVGIANAEGIGSKVEFLGNRDEREKIKWLRSASVFCLPSIEKSEAFGIVQLEAMACGLPVINTRIHGSGVQSLSIHNKTGITVDPANSQALTEAINTILGDNDMSKRMGEAGRERIKKYYTKEIMTQNILEVYNEVLI